MPRITILGSGAAPGVPAIAMGWGDCNPNNPKNRRLRAGTYIEYENAKILIDTSPDLRMHLLNNNIRYLDGVLLTHTHSDHLHGIDDLREINRISRGPLDFFATAEDMKVVHERFGYLFADVAKECNPLYRAYLMPRTIEYGKEFFIGDVSVVPLQLEGHNIGSTGYIFNGGEIVHISDFKRLHDEDVEKLRGKVGVMIMPLTTPHQCKFHANIDEVLQYAEIIRPQKLIINHMAVECDYDAISAQMPDFAEVAYDGMTIELKE